MFDRSENFRPAAFMDIAQELAAIGSERLHFADADLKPHGLVWILARMETRFDRLPRRGDNVIVQTWHKGLDGIFLIREYRMLGPDGTAAIRSTSSWIVMDLETRRVVRNERLEGIIDFEPQADDVALEHSCPKIVMPAGASAVHVADHTVAYSDVDYNGHANNARYSVWAMDCLPGDVAYTQSVKETAINFNREACPGETVALHHFAEGNVHFVEGRIENRQIFICRFVFG